MTMVTLRSVDREAIRSSIADECAISLDHAQEHLNSALESAGTNDMEQVAHDADVAARILLCVCWNAEKEVRDCNNVDD